MAISEKTIKILSIRSGNRCAFRECDESLVSEDGKTILGEVAHIIARSSDGPRGASHLKPDERDSLENLIYLCEKHHKIVDDQPQTFTALKLQQLKEDHERWVKQSISIKERFLGM